MTYETSLLINKITNSLINNYQQFPLDFENQIPSSNLDELINLADKESEWFTSLETLHQFINGVTKLDCFTYRAVNQVGDELVYWNALLQSFDEFKQIGTVIYQTDTPYPTADMIIAWCNRQVL
jgi:hypothetical protein